MRTAHRGELGRAGEDLAARLLEDDGLEILDRNWRDGRRGELDIVAVDPRDHTVVVAEVRTRTGTFHGSALESVDQRKLSRLRRLAAAWLAAHEVHGAVRMDVVAVTVPWESVAPGPAGGPAGALPRGTQVRWVKGVHP